MAETRPLTRPNPATTSAPPALPRRLRDRLGHLLVIAAALLAFGLIGQEVVFHTDDLPDPAELLADAKTVYAAPDGPGWSALLADHGPFVWAAKIAAVRINGEVDARVLTYFALALLAGAFALLLSIIRRGASLRRFALLTAAAAVVAVTPMAWPAIAPRTLDAATVALCFSLAHLALAAEARTGTGRWWAGFAVGLLGIVAASASVASAVALCIASAVRLARSPADRAEARRDLAANGVLLVVGLALTAVRGVTIGPTGAALACWPGEHGWQAALVWLPAILCVATAAVRPEIVRRTELMLPLAAWVMAIVGMAALTGGSIVGCTPLLWIAVVTNAALWCALRPRTRRQHTILFTVAGGWAILVACLLLQPSPVPERNAAHENAFAAALAGMTRGQKADDEVRLTATELAQCAEIARHPVLAPILPASVRAALPLQPETGEAGRAFWAEGAPPIAERESLPMVGTWSAPGPHRVGEFVSTTLRTTFPIVQLRIAGTLRPPRTSVVLKTAGGNLIPPLTGPVSGTARWRRVNFSAPDEPFQVIARSTSDSDWLAVAALVEVGPLTRLIAKVPVGWPTAALWTGGILAALAALPLALGLGTVLRRIPWRVVPWLALIGYVVFFSSRLDPTAGPNDSGGYLNSARLLANGTTTGTARTVFGAAAGETDLTPYVPITFHATGGRLVPEYPVGWPLELALFGKLFGFTLGVPLLMLLQLALGMWITQRLAQQFGLRRGWDWLAAGIVGLSPVYLFEGLQPVSDGPAMLFVGAAIYWAWLSRDRIGYAALAGAATALAVMIRPSNLLAVAPLLVCLGFRWRPLLLWMLCGIPGAAWLAWYQQDLYGSWLTTGYGSVSDAFALRFVAPTLKSYLTWLPEMLSPLVVLALAIPFATSVPGRIRWLLGSWVAAFAAFYATYWCTWDNWYNMRFVLPAFPAMIIAALLVLQAWIGNADRRRYLAGTALVIAMLVFVGVRTAMREVPFWMRSNHKPAEAAAWAREHLPPDAVIFAKHMTGSLYFYTNMTFVRLDAPVAHDPGWHKRVRRSGRPLYAITCHWETRGFQWGHGKGSGYPDVPGTWQRVTSLGDGEILVWRQVTP